MWPVAAKTPPFDCDLVFDKIFVILLFSKNKNEK